MQASIEDSKPITISIEATLDEGHILMGLVSRAIEENEVKIVCNDPMGSYKRYSLDLYALRNKIRGELNGIKRENIL